VKNAAAFRNGLLARGPAERSRQATTSLPSNSFGVSKAESTRDQKIAALDGVNCLSPEHGLRRLCRLPVNLANNRASTSPATLPSGIICAMARSQREFQLLPVHRATNKVRLGGLRPNYCQTGAIAFSSTSRRAVVSSIAEFAQSPFGFPRTGALKKAPEWVSGAPTPKPLPLGYGRRCSPSALDA
jgi:hypothetical protein